MKTILARLIGAFWPLLFLPLVMVVVRSKAFGDVQVDFELGEPMLYAALIYASVYCGFWLWGKEHGMSTIGSAVITIVGLALWQIMFPIAASPLQ